MISSGIAEDKGSTATSGTREDAIAPSHFRQRVPWRPLLVIAGVGIALRLIVTWAIWANGGSSLNGDEGDYLLSALSLSDGQGIPDVLLWLRAPGFIFFEGAVLVVTGGQILAVNLAQVALTIPMVILAYVLGRLTTTDVATGRRTGLWAAALVACNPLFIFYANLFISEPLFIVLLGAMLVALAMYGRGAGREGWRVYVWLAGAGAAAGLAWLTRSSILAYLPLVALWLVYLHRRAMGRAILSLLLFGAFVAVVVFPWSFHNLERYGTFILVDTTGPVNFYLDNTDSPLPQARSELGKIEGHAARQEYALRATLDWIGAHKSRFVENVVSRLGASWMPDPYAEMRLPVRSKLPGTASWVRDLYALAGSIAYVAVVILAVAGLIYSPRSNVKVLVLLFVISYEISAALSHNDPRYRLPSLALISVFGGYALAQRNVFWPVVDGGKRRLRAITATGFAVLFLVISLPAILPGLLNSVEARSLELSSHFQTDPRERAATLERVGRIDSVLSGPWREAGDAWASVGEIDKAAQDYFEAWYRETDDWRATAMLSKLYRDEGEVRKSEKTIDAIAPTYNAIMQRWAWEQFDPPDYELDVGGADIGWVEGFHAAETQVDGASVTYRWSTGSASMKVRRRADDRTVFLLARALPGTNGEPLTVRCFINGIDAGQRVMDGKWKSYEFKLSDVMLRGDTVVLEIQAPTRRPSPEDRRELAIAVDKVSTGP